MRAATRDVLIIGIVILNILVFPANQLLLGQSPAPLPSSPIPSETIKIVKPITTQNISMAEELIVSGISSDDAQKNCSVSVIVNNVRPYQMAVARGMGDINDFSQWEFILRTNYTQIIEGENKITSKLTCSSAPPRWYSVFVNAIPNNGNEEILPPSPVEPDGQPSTPVTNLSEVNDTQVPDTQVPDTQVPDTQVPDTQVPDTQVPDTQVPDTQVPDTQVPDTQVPDTQVPDTQVPDTQVPDTQVPDTQVPDTQVPDTQVPDTQVPDNGSNILSVSIVPLKNPVARGDSQNITITITDASSRPVANAEIDGTLIYPGEDFEKDFTGITDTMGKFVYSWIIGENGDVGPLSIELAVTSEGYPPTSVTDSFDIIDASGASEINNPVSDPLNNDNSQFDFVMAGDYTCDSATRQTVESMEEKNPDLVIALGDLSEVKNPQCFFDIVSELNDDGRFKITLGEHDTDSGNANSPSRYSQYIEHFEMQSPFYSFDFQNVHFLAMSTGKASLIPYVNGSVQYNFIKDDLAKAANDPNIDWIIVYGYRPIYTSPTVHPGNQILRVTYPPLFEKYGVDLVITAHNHNYQRSYPLAYNIENTRLPIIKDVNATDYYQPDVPIYVNVGTAGNNLYDFRAKAPFIVTQFLEMGFLHVNVTNTDRHELTGEFHNVQTGTIQDQFSIVHSKFQ